MSRLAARHDMCPYRVSVLLRTKNSLHACHTRARKECNPRITICWQGLSGQTLNYQNNTNKLHVRVLTPFALQYFENFAMVIELTLKIRQLVCLFLSFSDDADVVLQSIAFQVVLQFKT